MTKEIGAPQMRNNLQASLQSLLNKNWKIEYDIYFEYLLDSVYHTLYDTHDLDEKERSLDQVGKVFYDEAEAMAVHEFSAWFHELKENIEAIERRETPNETYFNHPDWPKVLKWAESVVKIMEDNNKKYNFYDNMV